MTRASPARIRCTRPEDIPGIVALSAREYGAEAAWTARLLESHLRVFPEGQFVAVRKVPAGGEVVVGMAASLIVTWNDYDLADTWRDFTDGGMFTNHDPAGRTLYGAEVVTDHTLRGTGIGTRLYAARQALVERLGLLRIRAGSRLKGYHAVAARMSAEAYVIDVVRGRRRDPTLSFQLRRGFRVIGVVGGYLRLDPMSLGWAAVIEWVNGAVAAPGDYALQRAWAARHLGERAAAGPA